MCHARGLWHLPSSLPTKCVARWLVSNSPNETLQSLFAYHIEALVPSQPSNHLQTARTPQKLNGNKDVQFFSVGTLNGRTLVIYMKKKGVRD